MGVMDLPGGIGRRTYAQEMEFLERVTPTQWRVREGFVPNMRVPGVFYVNKHLETLMFDELRQHVDRGDVGGFLPAVKQLANVAALPGIVNKSIALPDVHSGYVYDVVCTLGCIGTLTTTILAKHKSRASRTKSSVTPRTCEVTLCISS